MDELGAAIVIDCGSCMMKGGFSGDDEPKSIFPSIVGKRLNTPCMLGMGAIDRNYVVN